jgi:ADP-heptose:LPS heptosyltransferase
MGGVGDNLVASSVLAPLKRAGYMTEVITQSPFHVVWENNPHIDKLSVKQINEWPTGGLEWQQWFDNRGREYALFANFSHSMEHLIALLPAQTAFYWPISFRRKLCDRSYIETVHDIIGMPHEFGSLFYPTEAEKEKAAETKAFISSGGAAVIGWCISGTRIDKIYPSAPIVIARIIKELGANVVLFGAPNKDIELARVIQTSVGQQNGNTEGLHIGLSTDPDNPSWPIRRVLTMAAACDVMVGPDTGPMWGVAFEPVAKIMMLSHASPTNITKHWVNTVTLHANPDRVACWPCHRLHDTIHTCVPNKEGNGAACVSDINVETVIKTVAKLLEVSSNGKHRSILDKANAQLGDGGGGGDAAGGLGHCAISRITDLNIGV